MESFKVIDPRGTIFESLEVAQKISSWIVPESRGKIANMLPQKPEELLRQMEKGNTRLAIWNEEIVGHATLWKYNALGWGEIGSLIVAPLFRGQKIGREIVKDFCRSFSNPIRIITTVKTERARHVFCLNDFEEIKFNTLRKISELAWRECCPCFFPPENCPKRDKECRLMLLPKRG